MAFLHVEHILLGLQSPNTHCFPVETEQKEDYCWWSPRYCRVLEK